MAQTKLSDTSYRPSDRSCALPLVTLRVAKMTLSLQVHFAETTGWWWQEITSADKCVTQILEIFQKIPPLFVKHIIITRIIISKADILKEFRDFLLYKKVRWLNALAVSVSFNKQIFAEQLQSETSQMVLSSCTGACIFW